MAMPEFLDQDRFYLDLDNNQIEWMYHNPDSVTQGQFPGCSKASDRSADPDLCAAQGTQHPKGKKAASP